MAKEVKTPFDEILEALADKKSFVVTGGAGSGKTYNMVKSILHVIDTDPHARIACVTYTNAAVDEIESRITHQNLRVATIHDFMWDVIKHYQQELKICLIQLINDEESSVRSRDKMGVGDDFFDSIEEIRYLEYLRIAEGIITHDEVIELSHRMFQNYPKLRDIFIDLYSHVFVDEYQDTQIPIIEILLEYLKMSAKVNIIGFFGDSMQSIYDHTIGSLETYIEKGMLVSIQIKQNRRNPQSVIDLANQMRDDGLIQKPSTDTKAPNMNIEGSVKKGEARVLYSTANNIDLAKTYLGWDFHDSENCRELHLTHNLIAGKAGFASLMNIYNGDKVLDYRDRVRNALKDKKIEPEENLSFEDVLQLVPTCKATKGQKEFINDNPAVYKYALKQNWTTFSRMYVDKDQLIDDKKNYKEDQKKKGSKRGPCISHLYKLQNIIELYSAKKWNEFMREVDFPIKSIGSKTKLNEIMDSLKNPESMSIGQVVELGHIHGICIKGDKFDDFLSTHGYVWSRVKNVLFSEFQSLYLYLEGEVAFSTQHRIKGAEFDKVLVSLDNGNWNKYSFEGYFEGTSKETVLERTRKLLYVCCTRAKESLAIYVVAPNSAFISKAKEWFGSDNVVSLD